MHTSPTPIGHHRYCTCSGGAAWTHHQTRAGPEAVQTHRELAVV